MAHTYSSCFIHAVFSTRRRQRILSENTRERLWAFMQATARRNGFRLIAANGADDHVHLLMKLPTTIAAARAIQVLKKRSASFMGRPAAWQEGYTAISLDPTAIDDVVAYLARQDSLHQSKTFEEEYISMLKKNRIRFDLRYVFD